MPNVKAKPKEKKEMEYQDAPSGYVTLYNYKEPFMNFTKGFGYEGVLLFDGETDKIQCHLCGQWLGSLPHHLKAQHNMKADKYKESVGLNKTTALISETMRAKLVASGLDKRLQNLRKWKGIKRTQKTKEKIRASMKDFRRENQNRMGTCPEQIIDRLVKLYKKQGKTPDSHTLPFYEVMMKTYGSYKNACEVAGIPYNDPLIALERGRQTSSLKAKMRKENASQWILQFYDKNNILPKKSDFKTPEEIKIYKLLHNKSKKEYEKILKDIVVKHGKFSRAVSGFNFDKDELLKFLKDFEKINGRKPSYSDARRGLIPYLSRYSYHFGSWQNALKLAFQV